MGRDDGGYDVLAPGRFVFHAGAKPGPCGVGVTRRKPHRSSLTGPRWPGHDGHDQVVLEGELNIAFCSDLLSQSQIGGPGAPDPLVEDCHGIASVNPAPPT